MEMKKWLWFITSTVWMYQWFAYRKVFVAVPDAYYKPAFQQHSYPFKVTDARLIPFDIKYKLAYMSATVHCVQNLILVSK